VTDPHDAADPADAADLVVVKLTWGLESPERVSQALSVAATVLAAGRGTSLWLTGDATLLAKPGALEEVVLPFAAPLAELRDAILAGGTVTVCSQCAARRELTAEQLLPGVRLAGSAVFVAEILTPGARSLVY
jgi:predicted peroxiredoxin